MALSSISGLGCQPCGDSWSMSEMEDDFIERLMLALGPF